MTFCKNKILIIYSFKGFITFIKNNYTILSSIIYILYLSDRGGDNLKKHKHRIMINL